MFAYYERVSIVVNVKNSDTNENYRPLPYGEREDRFPNKLKMFAF